MLNIEQLEKRQCLTYGPMPVEPPIPSEPLFSDNAVADFDLETLYQSYSVEGVDFKEMRGLISSTSDDGYTDRLEYLQLQRYLRLSDMPEYVRYFADATLNGNFTTSDTIFFKDPQPLLDKWFNGKDLPDTPGSEYPYVEVKGQLFVDGITPDDPDQGRIGDCYFITALGATAQNCPDVISNMIKEVDENIWVVRFYDLAGEKQFVTVNNELPYMPNFWNPEIKRNSVFADWGTDPNDMNNELWPALLEKAFAQAAPNRLIRDRPNSYESIESGDPSWAFRYLAGQREIRIKGLSKQGHIDYIEANKPIMTWLNSQNHTYTFESYNAEEDKFFLRNPWGTHHIYMTWEELSDLPIVGSTYGGYVVDVNAEILETL